jgi:hypothetical protein
MENINKSSLASASLVDSKHDLKIQDFAYLPSSTPLPAVPEVFDQYEGLAEVEYRWTRSPQMYPVPGKTLGRLLELGWITQEDVVTHASLVDLEELRKYKARLPMYPWKALRWTTIPNTEERKRLMLTRLLYFQQRDTTRANAEMKAASNINKRRAEEHHEGRSGTKAKKKRNILVATQPFQAKQYPAPLHAYDPKIYPEVVFLSASSNPPSGRLVRQSTVTYISPCHDNEVEKENNN